jgi:capsular polysaccharide biosynthesis protein
MTDNFHNRALTVSQKIYKRLLRAYPKAHREAYGPAMAQLFHDQCRDAWSEARGLGVIKLWLRVLPDLVSTSIVERVAALNQRKFMTDKMISLVQPRAIFWKVFAIVFLLAVIYSVAVAFLVPETYASTAQITFRPGLNPLADSSAYNSHYFQKLCEVIQSPVILQPVINKLKLNDTWGKKYGVGKFKTSDTLGFLTNTVTVSRVGDMSLVDITVYSGDKMEAAQIANAIAESLRDYLSNTGGSDLWEVYKGFGITQTAVPGQVPVRPNKSFNIVLGAGFGILLAFAVGGIAALIVILTRKRTRKIPATA